MHFKVYTKYFYSRLNDTEKKVYNKVLEGWLKYKTQISIMGSYRDVDFKKILQYVYDDNPELFYIDTNYFAVNESSLRVIVNTRLRYDVTICEKMKNEIYVILNNVYNTYLDSQNKLATIHDFLVSNVSYSLETTDANTHDIYGTLVNKKAVCEGYARTFKLLCDMFDIACIYIKGTAVNDNSNAEKHAWNIVRIGGNAFHVDPTWNSTMKSMCGLTLYYCVSDAFIRRNHKWDAKIYPQCIEYGTVENKIRKIDNIKMLASYLEHMSKNKHKKGVIEYKGGFSSSQDAMDTIETAINASSNINIASFGSIYIKNLNCLIISFNY